MERRVVCLNGNLKFGSKFPARHGYTPETLIVEVLSRKWLTTKNKQVNVIKMICNPLLTILTLYGGVAQLARVPY